MKSAITPAKLRAHVAAAKAAGAREVVIEETKDGVRVKVVLRANFDPGSDAEADEALDSWEREHL